MSQFDLSMDGPCKVKEYVKYKFTFSETFSRLLFSLTLSRSLFSRFAGLLFWIIYIMFALGTLGPSYLLILSFEANFSFFSSTESPPRDLQITAYK